MWCRSKWMNRGRQKLMTWKSRKVENRDGKRDKAEKKSISISQTAGQYLLWTAI